MTLSISEIGTVVSAERRQRVIRALRAKEDVTLRHLSENLAEAEQGHRKPVYVSLHQHHLPKLDEKDIVGYQDDRKVISRGDNFREIDKALRLLENRQDSNNGLLSRFETAISR